MEDKLIIEHEEICRALAIYLSSVGKLNISNNDHVNINLIVDNGMLRAEIDVTKEKPLKHFDFSTALEI